MDNTLGLSLLRELDFEDYNSLIAQIELVKAGYELYFVIDADLINNYCYPLGIIPENTKYERKSKLSPDYLADEQITLHTLFYLNDNHKRLLLLDQYCYEVEAMLYMASKEGKRKLDDLDIHFPIFKLDNKNNSLMELLFESFSSMYSKVLLHINGLKKASHILKDRKLLLDSNELDSPTVKKIIDASKGSERDSRVISEIMSSLINEKKEDPNYNSALFMSKKRDAIIIDRILSFNREIQKIKFSERKKIFILLSDSTLLKNTIVELSKNKTAVKYPNLQGKRIMYYRNIAQSFAYLISLVYTKNGFIDFYKTKNNLKELQKASLLLNKRFNKTSVQLKLQTNELLSISVFANYNRLRNAFENSGLLKSFEPLFESIKNDLKTKSIKDVANIFLMFKNEGQNYIKEIESQHIYFLRTLLNVGNFNTSFVYGIDKVKNEGAMFDLSKGADYIEGNYHHLPLLLTFSSIDNSYIDSMYELIKLVLSHHMEDSINICNQLENILAQMNSSSIYDNVKTEINLIKAFIFMILPSMQNRDKIKDNDTLAHSWLKDLNINENDYEALKNKYYLTIWSSRRIQRYNESIKLAKKAIKDFPDDPRFYHGLFLSQYCLYEESIEMKSPINIHLIENMLKNLDKAYILYPPFILSNFSYKNLAPLIREAIRDSYSNSYSYCLCLKAQELEKTGKNVEYVSLIKNARTTFNNIKNSNNCYKDNLAEYYDTEAFIEYYESYCLENDERISKLKAALNTISMAIDLSNNEALTKKYISKRELIYIRMKEIETEIKNI